MASSRRITKEELIAQDMKRLHAMGYAQELFCLEYPTLFHHASLS